MRQVPFWAHAMFVILSSSAKRSVALSKCEHDSIRECTCSNDTQLGRVTVDCSYVGLKSVPENLPLNVTHLYLDYNKIVSLQNGSFGRGRLQYLTFLSIKHNQMKEI